MHRKTVVRAWLTIMVVMASLLLVPTAGTASTAHRRPCSLRHFSDYFTASTDPAWRFVNRAGQVSAGRLMIDGDYLPVRLGRDGWAVTHVGSRQWCDYRFTADYDTTNATGSPDTVHMSTFYFRMVTSGAKRMGTFYRLDVWDPGQADPRGPGMLPDGLVMLSRYNHGTPTLLRQRERSNTVTGSNHVSISAAGAQLTVRVNGSRVVSVKDPHPIRYGGVGLGQIWETNGSFDNVVVRH